MRLSLNTLFNVFIFSVLTVGFFYSSYRYPFMINNSGTSPTYSDTPAILSIGKYLIVVSITVVYVVLLLKNLQRLSSPIGATFALCIILFFLESFVLENDIMSLQALILFLPGLLVFARGKSIRVKSDTLYNWIYYIGLISLLVTLIQVVLFFTCGRLPALAYANSFSVRFGSFLDDPNGFGILNFLFIGILIPHKKNKWKWILLCGFLLNLILTQSVTTYLCFLFLIPLVSLLINNKMVDKIIWSIFSISAIASIISILYIIIMQNPIFEELILSKSESASGHSKSLDIFLGADWTNFLGLSNLHAIGESSFLINLVNHGVFFTFIFYSFFIFAIAKIWMRYQKIQDIKGRSLYFAVFFFLVSFLIGSLNLPTPYIFPINLLAFFFASLVISNSIQFTNELF